MSKERARRRAERDEVRAQELALRRRRDARRVRRSAVRAAVVPPRPTGLRFGFRGQQGILARRRRMQNFVIGGLFVVSQMFVWLFTDDPWWRVTGALIGVFSLPVLVTLALDRRR